MNDKFAAKHTNSISLKKQKLLLKESESNNCFPYLKPYKLTIFCIVSCCIFFIYWFVLTPFLISTFANHHSGKIEIWSGNLILYWLIAFLIWLFIMLCLIIIWKCVEIKNNNKMKLQSYGTNSTLKSGSLINTKLDYLQNAKLKNKPLHDLIIDKNKISHDKLNINNSDELQYNKLKRYRDLPPLMIHRRNSGNDIEHTGIVNVKKNINESINENNEDEYLEDELKSGNNYLKNQKESIKDYLKLVTVTPQDKSDTNIPKESLSPRELFFIDLIREAEKAERNRENNPQKTEKKHFFSDDFSPTEKDVNKNLKEEKKLIKNLTDHRTTYFIADIKSPKNEKTEVFLKIESDYESAKKSMNLNDRKPTLVLGNTSKDEENENLKDKIILL